VSQKTPSSVASCYCSDDRHCNHSIHCTSLGCAGAVPFGPRTKDEVIPALCEYCGNTKWNSTYYLKLSPSWKPAAEPCETIRILLNPLKFHCRLHSPYPEPADSSPHRLVLSVMYTALEPLGPFQRLNTA
jgi:hypothetical protein